MASESGQLSREETGGKTVIRARGKLDQDLGEELVRMVEQASGAIVVSLGGVVYLSSSGIAALVKVAMKRDLRIAAAPACVLDVLDLAGVQSLFRFFQDEAGALGGKAPA